MAASKPKWWVDLNEPLLNRIKQTSKNKVPTITWRPWNPVATKNTDPNTEYITRLILSICSMHKMADTTDCPLYRIADTTDCTYNWNIANIIVVTEEIPVPAEEHETITWCLVIKEGLTPSEQNKQGWIVKIQAMQ